MTRSTYASILTLRRWETGLLRIATALDTSAGPVLASHAGLTWGTCTELGEPLTPERAVQALQQQPEVARRPGRMLADADLSLPPGVLWAEAGHELCASWLRAEHAGVLAPLGKVHGHSSAWNWARQRSTVRRRDGAPVRRRAATAREGGALRAAPRRHRPLLRSLADWSVGTAAP